MLSNDETNETTWFSRSVFRYLKMLLVKEKGMKGKSLITKKVKRH